jgi:hypothetical protein
MTPVSAPQRLPNIALLLGLAWLVVMAQLLADHWAETAQTFPDMDDAMRMVEVRSFLDGRGWFDLHEARLGPPDGYDTHWSRLIDAGIAGLILAAQSFVDGALAERLARTIWPMLWLLPAIAGVAAIAWRLAGRAGAQIASPRSACRPSSISFRGGSTITMSRSHLRSSWLRRRSGRTGRGSRRPRPAS